MTACFSPKKMSILVVMFLAQSLLAQKNTIIPIETQHNAIALQVGEDLRVSTVYFGTRLKDTAEYKFVHPMYRRGEDYSGILNAAYTPAGSRNLVEPAIEVTHANGNTSLDLQYVSHTIEKTDDNVSVTSILLKDPAYALEVSLFFKTFFKEDVVEQWSIIRNKEKGTVTLQKYASANLYLTANDYWLKQFHGDWAKEMQPEDVLKLTPQPVYIQYQ